ncbi:TetR/AcrR family transcriptional regulator [Kibdelosporangium philippinense]|uniref:TetR/AcrR family transcriptional regulator n=1 Tax=Kibdelosporangium philippinense TaxID=211113 RepID=A0ABS8ZC38_9PSEU|nr:TetR/AcrR family transcriptional regulator [Kibdelosporangium philippinense]MCE7005438.1 TetR/AcrR family transcriptional regulator [Kibdelosporangium philippinense]
MVDAKQRLLSAAVDHVAEHGVGEQSLRQIAAALGTSHRMLIYHFGSKEGLLVEIIKAVEARQREVLADLAHEPGESAGDMGRRFWKRISDPALWPNIRLFFEVYGQALQGRPGTTHLLDDVVHAWLDPVIAVGVAQGLSEEDARVTARLGLAVTRGLLLDLLATGDREAVDAAMERYIVSYEAQLPGRASPLS